jgi:hypothetical protein
VEVVNFNALNVFIGPEAAVTENFSDLLEKLLLDSRVVCEEQGSNGGLSKGFVIVGAQVTPG